MERYGVYYHATDDSHVRYLSTDNLQRAICAAETLCEEDGVRVLIVDFGGTRDKVIGEKVPGGKWQNH